MQSDNTIHTVTLEAQGIHPDIARHRRSVAALPWCQRRIKVERWRPELGCRVVRAEPCKKHAVALTETGVNLCAAHVAID